MTNHSPKGRGWVIWRQHYEHYHEYYIIVIIIILPPVGVQSIGISVTVCLSACLSTRIILNAYVEISPNCRSVHVADRVRGSVLLWQQYNVMYFRFFWMTSCFHITEQMGQNQKQLVSFSSPGGGSGGDVCRLRQHVAIITFVVIINMQTNQHAGCTLWNPGAHISYHHPLLFCKTSVLL